MNEEYKIRWNPDLEGVKDYEFIVRILDHWEGPFDDLASSSVLSKTLSWLETICIMDEVLSE